MASSSSNQRGPTPTSTTPSQGGVPLPIPQNERQSHFDNAIWLTLALWPALTVAVTNAFGGPDSSDKRDWFAGAISTLFAERPETDHDDLVEFLLQVMQDEFDVRVEDESEEAIAGELVGLRRKVYGEGSREVYDSLVGRWKGRGKLKVELVDEEGEWSGVDDDDDDDDDVDVEMGGTEPVVREKKEKPAPEIDEDGFEKVVSKKKR